MKFQYTNTARGPPTMSNGISIRRRWWSPWTPRCLYTARFLSLYFGQFVTRAGRTGGPSWSMCASFDVFPPKNVLLGVPLILNAICGSHLKKSVWQPAVRQCVFLSCRFCHFFIGHSSSCIFGIKWLARSCWWQVTVTGRTGSVVEASLFLCVTT